jgi:hypothetical protein
MKTHGLWTTILLSNNNNNIVEAVLLSEHKSRMENPQEQLQFPVVEAMNNENTYPR